MEETLRAAASTLALSDRTLGAASAYSRSSPAASSSDVATASVFLAAKACEEPRRVRDVINAVHLAQEHELLRDSREYWARKERAVLDEQLLLRAMGYHTDRADTQVLLLNVLRALNAPRALYELCIALVNDGGLACAAFPSRVLVAAAMAVGATALDVQLPAHWQRVLEVDGDEQVAAACDALLDAYDRPARPVSEATTRMLTDPPESGSAGAPLPEG